MLRLALVNLISNAVKYTPPGGKVIIAIKKQDRDILIEVTDNGYGIPKAQQGKIFREGFNAAAVRFITSREGFSVGAIQGSAWHVRVSSRHPHASPSLPDAHRPRPAEIPASGLFEPIAAREFEEDSGPNPEDKWKLVHCRRHPAALSGIYRTVP